MKRRFAKEKRNIGLVGILLLTLLGCATPPPPPPPPTAEYLNLTVQAVKSGQLTPSLESAYNFVSTIKSFENVIIIYDASGSMLWPTLIGGEPRYLHAYRSLSKYFEGLRERDNVGLIVFGSRYPSGIFAGNVQNMAAARRSCTEDIETTVPLGRFRKGSFTNELDRLSQSRSYKGDTPIGGAILAGVDILKEARGERKHIIVITDGGEECYHPEGPPKGVPGAVSPDKAIQKAKELGITVSIVGYGIGHGKDGKIMVNPQQTLESLKNLANGVFVVANTGEELLRALMQVEVENFRFALIDQNGRTLGRFKIGERIKVNMMPYTYREPEPEKTEMEKILSQVKEAKDKLLDKEKPVEPPKPIRVKFTISAAGERVFKKTFGVTSEMEDVKLFLGLKSATDTDPDIAPENLKWTE
jgi:hypothetical protein